MPALNDRPADGAGAMYSIHVSTADSWRGGENQLWLLARGLQQRGHKVLVAAPPGAPLHERCKQAGLASVPIKMHGEIDPLGVFRLAKLLRRERPSILHLHDSHAVLTGHLAAGVIAAKTMKVVAHRRQSFSLKGRWKWQGRINRVVAISSAVRDRLTAGGLSADQVRIVFSGVVPKDQPKRLGADDPHVIALRDENGIPQDSILIGHAAAFSDEKRQRDMLIAMEKANSTLKAKNKAQVHLALAGAGRNEAHLREEVRRLKLSPSVHFLGFLRDLTPLWSASNLAMYASDNEGLCTALVEAQSFGLPAVVTRGGGMVEAVNDSTAVLVEIGDTVAMAEAIVRLSQDAALRERMGRDATEHACRRFSVDQMVDGNLAVYRELWAL